MTGSPGRTRPLHILHILHVLHVLHILHILHILHFLHILHKIHTWHTLQNQTPFVISFPKKYKIIGLSVVPVFVDVCISICICIFSDPAYGIQYSESFCPLLFKNILHHRYLRFSLYLSLLFLGGTGSVYCGTGWYLVYWVRTGQYWLPVRYAFRKYMVYMT